MRGCRIALSRRSCRQCFDVIAERRTLEIDRPVASGDDCSAAIYHDSPWRNANTGRACHMHIRIERHRQRIFVLGQKWAHCLSALTIDRDREHRHAALFILFLCPLHGGHLTDADVSPRRPEAGDDDFAAQIVRSQCAASCRLQIE